MTELRVSCISVDVVVAAGSFTHSSSKPILSIVTNRVLSLSLYMSGFLFCYFCRSFPYKWRFFFPHTIWLLCIPPCVCVSHTTRQPGVVRRLPLLFPVNTYKMRCRHEQEQQQQQQQSESPESQQPCFHVVSSWHCLLETAIHGQLDGRDAAPVAVAAPAPTPQTQTYWIHVNEDVWCGCFLHVSFAFKDAERSSDDVYHLSSLTQCSELGGITQSL